MPACCPEGSHGPAAPSSGYVSKGTFQEVDGLSYYCVGQGEHAILVGHDVYGASSGRTQEICDGMAESLGVVVVVPEFFGKGCSIQGCAESAYLFDGNLGWGAWYKVPALVIGSLSNLPCFLRNLACFKWDKVGADVRDKVMPMLRQRGVKRFGAMGFCWGGWFVTHISSMEEISCGVTFHPSAGQVAKMLGDNLQEMCDKVQCPQMLLAAGPDEAVAKEGGLMHKAYGAKPHGKDCVFRTFCTMKHGWVNRGPDEDGNNISGERAAAVDAARGFFRQHLLQAGSQ